MRTLFCIALGAIVIVGGYLVFGGHISQWTREAKQAVNEASSDGHIQGMVESDLSKAEEELKKLYVDVYQAKVAATKLEAATNVLKDNLVKEEKIFVRAQELLGKSKAGQGVLIGMVSYTWDQVNDDVLRRVGTCKVLRSTITANEQSLSKLNKAYEDGMEMIRQKKDELRRKKIEFEAEKAQLAALRAQSAVNAVVGRVYSSGSIQTDLGEAQKEFERRLNDERARAEFNERMGVKAGTVSTWGPEIGVPSENAVDAIHEYFKSQEPKADAPKPGVGEALENLPPVDKKI